MKTQSYSGQVRELFSKIGVGREKAALNNLQSNCLALDSKEAYTKKMIAPPTAKDAKKMVPITNEILLYLSTLNIVMFDIVAEYEDAGWYKQATKKNLNNAAKKVREIFDKVYRTIAENETDKRGTTSYNEAMLDTYNVINDAILLQAPERSWNTAVALIRLILALNAKLGNYEVVEVEKLSNVAKLLNELECKPDDYHLDEIIQITLNQHF